MGSLRSLRRKEVETVLITPPTDEELIQAIQFGTVKQVSALLAQGANPNATDAHSDTALAYAAHLGKLQIVQVLLKNGADVNQKGELEAGALYLAAACPCSTRQEICRLLLDSGADVNAADCDGHTPLMIAATFLRFHFAGLLVERGANPKLRNRDGQRAVDLIGHGGGSKPLRKLLKPIS